MRIRFTPQDQRAVYEKGDVKIVLFPCDRTDINVSWKRMGVSIPADAWEEREGRSFLNRSKLTPEVARRVEQDDDFLIASKLESIEGIAIEDDAGTPLDLLAMSEQDRTDLVTLLRQSMPEFSIWCAQYVRGGEKKSGRMVAD